MKRKFLLIAALVCALPLLANAQFNSGSTGTDGALDLSSNCQPDITTGACEVQLPESGILNYTTITIPNGKTLVFKRNSRNTPAILLAQGNVNIVGTIDLSAGAYVYCPQQQTPCYDYRIAGPGGFNGGDSGRPGFGPGGGVVSTNPALENAKWVGSLSLIPIVGGSGGAGSYIYGGGGGGAVVIASSTSINISGYGGITAYGQSGPGGGTPGARCGSGGAIRLVANSITTSNTSNLNAPSCNGANPNGVGVIRVEATQIDFRAATTPAATLSTINPVIVSSAQPQLTIASVGGYPVPSYSGSRFDTVDLLLPNQLTDPINVVIQATNIPSGTPVQVGFASGGASATSTSCTLTGGPGPLQCTATISNLNRTGVTYLLATATFTPPANFAQLNPKGENNVAKIRLESILGAKPKYVFLRNNNSVIDYAKLPKDFLQQFGM